MKIALLIPVCSRSCNFSSIQQTPLHQILYPSFVRTKESQYEYVFYIGMDDDDLFYQQHKSYFISQGFHIVDLKGCQHAPAWAWNQLYAEAVKDISIDYFYQLADDVELVTEGWTSKLIQEINVFNGFGLVGPIDVINYQQRVNGGSPLILENVFITRKHYDTFGFLFHPEVKNWYCDQLLTDIYRESNKVKICTDVIIKNNIRDVRYNIIVDDKLKNNYASYVQQCRSLLKKKVFSFCIYGTNKKYLDGLLENLKIIQKEFPLYHVFIYGGTDVPEEYIELYKQYKVKYIACPYNDLQLMYERFFAIDCDDVEIMFVRDADSRIEQRDQWCIREFIALGQGFHIIRDHEHHSLRIMGGMWGMRKQNFNLRELYLSWKQNHLNVLTDYRSDQLFLGDCVYPLIKSSVLVHSPYSFYQDEKVHPILVYDDGVNFVGNVVENNKYVFKKFHPVAPQWKISVLIPSFNRFDTLMEAIESVKQQTYPVHELIVINDNSTDPRYYTYSDPQVKMIHLKKGSKEIYGFPNISYTINQGVDISSGDYIARLDDDDIWLPTKLFLQVARMQKTGCRICSTEGLIAYKTRWNKDTLVDDLKDKKHLMRYPLYNSQFYLNTFIKNGWLKDTIFPEIWDLEFLKKHNFVIHSSVLIEKKLLVEVGKYITDYLKEDWNLWLRCLEKTKLCYVSYPCFVYHLRQ
jgi:hypothetical protein